MGYIIINLKDIYNSIGEKKTKEKLKEFECDQNKDVEYFIREKAIEFSKQLIAETFIVMAEYKGENVIVGYFSITNKSIIIRKTFIVIYVLFLLFHLYRYPNKNTYYRSL